jgi:rhamnulokinase
MPKARNLLAIDLGAESGRTIVGSLAEGKLTLSETHRFANAPVRLNDGLHWDVLRLWLDIKNGISKSKPINSLGLDTWGVDFALLDREGGLIANPFHYRDARTDGMLDEAFKYMPREEIFTHTGIQFMQFNTLFQLFSMVRTKSPQLEIAQTFLTIPDLLNFWLSGEITNEFTNATTTQCLNPVKRDWSHPVLQALGIPTRLFGPVTNPGTPIGTLLPGIAEETGAGQVKVVIPACHDTGSAVVAVPAKNENFAWLSSGTWSIMGVELKEPILSDQALRYNFTNEGGVFDTWRLSKNIMGLWIVQECRREWKRQGSDYSYDEMTGLASESDAFIAVINPDDDIFFPPGNMPQKIQEYCLQTGQRVPQSHAEILRVALESLALKYRWVLERLEELTDKKFAPIHIIGGGTKNRLLNQFTADATNRTVLAGPVEATAIGNVLMQAVGIGDIASIEGAREIVRASFEVEEYTPASQGAWETAYQKLLDVLDLES